jgi:hypothetical protein
MINGLPTIITPGESFMPPFVGYHGLTGQQHQQRVNELAAEEFRPISLSVSGDSGDER